MVNVVGAGAGHGAGVAVAVGAEKAEGAVEGNEGSDVNSVVSAGGTRAGGAESFCDSLLAR